MMLHDHKAWLDLGMCCVVATEWMVLAYFGGHNSQLGETHFPTGCAAKQPQG